MKKSYKFQDIIIYQDGQTGELLLATTESKEPYREDSFIRDGRKMRYAVSAFSGGYSVRFLNPEDENRWTKFSKKSVTERLLGITLDDEQELSIEELKALEMSLNFAQNQSYEGADVVLQDGVGSFNVMKKGDLLFMVADGSGYMWREINGRYSVITPKEDSSDSTSETSILVTLKGTAIGHKASTAMVHIGIGDLTTYGDFGVFPDRSYYLDAAEYPRFTIEAYKNMLALKMQNESENGKSGKGE